MVEYTWSEFCGNQSYRCEMVACFIFTGVEPHDIQILTPPGHPRYYGLMENTLYFMKYGTTRTPWYVFQPADSLYIEGAIFVYGNIKLEIFRIFLIII